MVEGQPPAACHAVALGGQKHTPTLARSAARTVPRKTRASTKQDRWSAKRNVNGRSDRN